MLFEKDTRLFPKSVCLELTWQCGSCGAKSKAEEVELNEIADLNSAPYYPDDVYVSANLLSRTCNACGKENFVSVN